jgi:hypothetical protein
VARVNTDAAITLFLGAVEMTFEPAYSPELLGNVPRVRLELLNANDVGTRAREPWPEAFAGSRTYAVQVERYNSDHR